MADKAYISGLIPFLTSCAIFFLFSSGCGNAAGNENGEVVVYNWGEYLDPEAISLFEEETGIQVIYF
mgnify:CR=1 FL=1